MQSNTHISLLAMILFLIYSLSFVELGKNFCNLFSFFRYFIFFTSLFNHVYAKMRLAIIFGLQMISNFFTCFRFSGISFYFEIKPIKYFFFVLCGESLFSLCSISAPFLVCSDSKFKLNQIQILALNLDSESDLDYISFISLVCSFSICHC